MHLLFRLGGAFRSSINPIHHIAVTSPDILDVHERTLYNYMNAGFLSAKRGDQPRACRYRARKRKPEPHKVDKACRKGRTYVDYLAFLGENPDFAPVQMDSVIGTVGGQVLLTLTFTGSNLLLAFLRERNDAHSVSEIFERLRDTVRQTRGTRSPEAAFRRMFGLILTDNGSEFSDPRKIEGDAFEWARVFYCDPMNTNQKAACERNHEFIRTVLPKGTSFDSLAQPDINLMCSHINSYVRPSLGDAAPYDIFRTCFGLEFLDALDIHRIPAREIVLKPSLLEM